VVIIPIKNIDAYKKYFANNVKAIPNTTATKKE
jgi:hypothetical protein